MTTVAQLLLVAIMAQAILDCQASRINRKEIASSTASSLNVGGELLNTTVQGYQCEQFPAEHPYGKYEFMETVAGLPEFLFAVFGDGLANAPDAQFMVWQGREKGSTTWGAKVDSKVVGESPKFMGLDYYFVKGPLCVSRCSADPKCCVGDKSFFPGTPAKSLVPHGNRPSKVAKAVVLPWKMSARSTYSPPGLGLTFNLEGVDGVLKAHAQSEGGEACYVNRVHVCESNMKGGSSFQPTKFDIIGTLASGAECVVPHS
jgi:hypothetical protein